MPSNTHCRGARLIAKQLLLKQSCSDAVTWHVHLQIAQCFTTARKELHTARKLFSHRHAMTHRVALFAAQPLSTESTLACLQQLLHHRALAVGCGCHRYLQQTTCMRKLSAVTCDTSHHLKYHLSSNGMSHPRRSTLPACDKKGMSSAHMGIHWHCCQLQHWAVRSVQSPCVTKHRQ
jgi:hypothetical protein